VPPANTREEFEKAALPLLPAAYRFARRLAGSDADAMDLVQEAYLRAFRTRDAFTPGTNARAWLFQILYSVFVNTYRSSRREPTVVSLDTPDELAAPAADDPAADSLRCSAPEVEAAFGALPEPYRSAVALVDLEELSYEEAAAALSCPVGTLRSRLFRGRRQLAASLRDYALRSGYLKERSRP